MAGLFDSLDEAPCASCGKQVKFTESLSKYDPCPHCGEYIDGHKVVSNDELHGIKKPKIFNQSVLSHIAGIKSPRGNRRADADENEIE